MSSHPYENLEARAFWRTAIAESNFELQDIYRPRFPISQKEKIAAAGSCFAQHISRQFKDRGYNFLDTEPAPPLLPEALWHSHGYDLYSARYGNIYTARQLWQLIQRAFGQFSPKERVWANNGSYFDPFRPAIEPKGFRSMDEFNAISDCHLKSVASLFESADIFIFTFGLTEGWVHRDDSAVYPVCPGTAAGEFDLSKHAFHNFDFVEIVDDMKRVIEFLRAINPAFRFLFTVSPVPLTATASGNHILPATVYSKSVLRAVCGTLMAQYDFVDYFPSYEIIASHPSKARFFETNMRSVSPVGVQFVMSHFFGQDSPTKENVTPRDEIREGHRAVSA